MNYNDPNGNDIKVKKVTVKADPDVAGRIDIGFKIEECTTSMNFSLSQEECHQLVAAITNTQKKMGESPSTDCPIVTG